jgi:hypothetical protein
VAIKPAAAQSAEAIWKRIAALHGKFSSTISSRYFPNLLAAASSDVECHMHAGLLVEEKFSTIAGPADLQ